MTFEKAIFIHCEHASCDKWRRAPRSQSVQLARRSLKPDGWTFNAEHGDRCPDHPGGLR